MGGNLGFLSSNVVKGLHLTSEKDVGYRQHHTLVGVRIYVLTRADALASISTRSSDDAETFDKIARLTDSVLRTEVNGLRASQLL